MEVRDYRNSVWIYGGHFVVVPQGHKNIFTLRKISSASHIALPPPPTTTTTPYKAPALQQNGRHQPIDQSEVSGNNIQKCSLSAHKISICISYITYASDCRVFQDKPIGREEQAHPFAHPPRTLLHLCNCNVVRFVQNEKTVCIGNSCTAYCFICGGIYG